jgi:hypothetical protein
MDFSPINWLAVLVAALAAFVIGFLWHGPVFGKQWIKLMEIPQAKVDEMQAKGMGPMVPHMITSFIEQFVMALVTAHLAAALGITDAMPAVLLAVMLWLGYIVTTLLNTVLWEHRKINLFLFKIVYHLVSLVAIALIVVLWR